MLFEPVAEQVVIKLARSVKLDDREQLREDCRLALDYLEGCMRDDIVSELHHRFYRSQAGDAGQEIMPFTVPLVQRYVEEAADAYNREVRRYFVDENGKENEATKRQTDKLARMLDPARYDEVMHRHEQLSILLKSNALWYEAKRGKLRAVPRFTCDVFPVMGDDPSFIEASDPDDYAGFVMELFWATEDLRQAQERTFAFVTAAQITYFTGRGPNEPDKILSTYTNPFRWPQVVDQRQPDGTLRPAQPADAPGLMLTFLQPKLPMGALIPGTDVDLVMVNREINIALSSLLDTIRFQGHSVMVKKVANPSDPKAYQPHGVRFPVVTNIADAIEALSFTNDYAGQMKVLTDIVKLMAMLKRMSPHDFAIEGNAPESGFAKLVQSLPKLEARRERLRPLKFFEEHVAAPRLVAIGTTLGLLDQEARKMRLRAQFADIELPESQEERAKRLDTDIRHNLTTPAQELAKRLRIPVEEAEKIVEENREKNTVDREAAAEVQAKAAGPGFGGGGGFGAAIRRPARPQARE